MIEARLIEALGAAEPSERRGAAQEIGESGDPQAVAVLLAQLNKEGFAGGQGSHSARAIAHLDCQPDGLDHWAVEGRRSLCPGRGGDYARAPG
jgi:HEAT repeat protein